MVGQVALKVSRLGNPVNVGSQDFVLGYFQSSATRILSPKQYGHNCADRNVRVTQERAELRSG